MPNPDRAAVLRLCSTATVLTQSLERELQRVEPLAASAEFKEIYDTVYLPRLTALRWQTNVYIPSDDWGLLAQPLHRDLASTQIHIVLEMLRLLVMAFRPGRIN